MTLDIEGMTCAACATRIEKGLHRLEGVTSATVNLATNSAVVEYKEGVTSVEDILEKIKKLGYKGQIRTEEQDDAGRKEERLKQNNGNSLFPSFIVAFALYDGCPYAVSYRLADAASLDESVVPASFSDTGSVLHRRSFLCRGVPGVTKQEREHGRPRGAWNISCILLQLVRSFSGAWESCIYAKIVF